MVEVRLDIAPAVNTTEFPVFVTGDKRESVFDSALVEVKVQVETPVEASVAEHAA
jgi:hypothetical protein